MFVFSPPLNRNSLGISLAAQREEIRRQLSRSMLELLLAAPAWCAGGSVTTATAMTMVWRAMA